MADNENIMNQEEPAAEEATEQTQQEENTEAAEAAAVAGAATEAVADVATDGKKKDNHLPFIIALIVIFLLFSTTLIVTLTVLTKDEDRDIVIARLINTNATGTAREADEGYYKAKNVGYVLNNLLLTGEYNAILWDSKNDCYVLCNGAELIYAPVDHPSEGFDLWIYRNDLPKQSRNSVYWCTTHKVTRDVLDEDGNPLLDKNGDVVTKDYYYTNHDYQVTVNTDSRTYTCTEDGCGLTYTVKNAH